MSTYSGGARAFLLRLLGVYSILLTAASQPIRHFLLHDPGQGQGQTFGGNRPLRVVDLAHPLEANGLSWPGFPGFNLSHLVLGNTPGGFWLEANWLSASEHGGTHVDVPAHFAQGGQHLHELPVDRFIGPAVLLEAATQADRDPDFQLGVAELQSWERTHGLIPRNSIVLVRFGWSSRWPDRLRYFNTATPQNPASFHFPGVGLEALRWLVEQRSIQMIGADVPSIDRGQETAFRGHRYLCANGIPFVESLTNLDQLPARGMTFFAVPLKVVGGSGGPVRAFAIISRAAGLMPSKGVVAVAVAAAILVVVKRLA